MLEYAGVGGWAGKRVAISGSGNVAQYAALKIMELGGTVVSLSDSRSALVAVEGGRTITEADVKRVMELKDRRRPLSDLLPESEEGGSTSPGGLKHLPGARPWTHVGKVDVALPCATENEVSQEEAEALVAAGCRFVAEGSNMGCEQGAIDVFEANRRSKGKGDAVWYAPGKAANCGGVAVSGLEMGQNSSVSLESGLPWCMFRSKECERDKRRRKKGEETNKQCNVSASNGAAKRSTRSSPTSWRRPSAPAWIRQRST